MERSYHIEKFTENCKLILWLIWFFSIQVKNISHTLCFTSKIWGKNFSNFLCAQSVFFIGYPHAIVWIVVNMSRVGSNESNTWALAQSTIFVTIENQQTENGLLMNSSIEKKEPFIMCEPISKIWCHAIFKTAANWFLQ